MTLLCTVGREDSLKNPFNLFQSTVQEPFIGACFASSSSSPLPLALLSVYFWFTFYITSHRYIAHERCYFLYLFFFRYTMNGPLSKWERFFLLFSSLHISHILNYVLCAPLLCSHWPGSSKLPQSHAPTNTIASVWALFLPGRAAEN